MAHVRFYCATLAHDGVAVWNSTVAPSVTAVLGRVDSTDATV